MTILKPSIGLATSATLQGLGSTEIYPRYSLGLPTHLKLLQGDCALRDELVCILLQHRHLSVDLLIHEWLCEHGLIHLIVATPAVTDLQGSWRMGAQRRYSQCAIGAHLAGHTL